MADRHHGYGCSAQAVPVCHHSAWFPTTSQVQSQLYQVSAFNDVCKSTTCYLTCLFIQQRNWREEASCHNTPSNPRICREIHCHSNGELCRQMVRIHPSSVRSVSCQLRNLAFVQQAILVVPTPVHHRSRWPNVQRLCEESWRRYSWGGIPMRRRYRSRRHDEQEDQECTVGSIQFHPW